MSMTNEKTKTNSGDSEILDINSGKICDAQLD